METIIEELEKEIGSIFKGEASGHDIHHLKRVLNLALHLQEKEGGDRLIIGVAAFLHDIHRIIGKETGTFCSPKDSLPKIKELLGSVDIEPEKKEKILNCVEFHEEYDFSEEGKTARDLETLIVQDADNLDAIGAIGIGRTFSYGGVHDLPMWAPEKPFDREHFDESENDPSTIHHFYSKLLRLKDNMNTMSAKELAGRRHEYMKNFLEEFFSEWEGRK